MPRSPSTCPAESGAASAAESKERFINAYHRLQGLAATLGEGLPIPEIVVIGGQSEGKSSLLQALLGFRFNLLSVEMSTRRPLVLHMINDNTAIEPIFRFQDEDSPQYGEPIDYNAIKIADIIKSRTESHIAKIQAAVSSTPIVAKVEYAHCSNLTVIDTPGLVLEHKRGEPETTPAQIEEMVVAQASRSHRMILFVQQSSLEWCSFPHRRIIKKIDPSFKRTVFVMSKFDNRLKEFKTGSDVNHYLSAAGATDDFNGNTPRFFVFLPTDTAISNEEFRKRIYELDATVLVKLRDLGFDEQKYGSYIGFSCLQKYLISDLLKRYKEAAPDIKSVLKQKCTALSMDLARLDSRLKTIANPSWFRAEAMQHMTNIWRHLIALLDGVADPALQISGTTTEDERIASGIVSWPGIEQPVEPPNSGLKLYGAAAFGRVMAEFHCAAELMECPHVSQGKVDSMLHGHAGSNRLTKPAAEIAREAARSCLAPLIDTACGRLAFVLRSLFDLALQRNRNKNKRKYHHDFEDMNNYTTFGAAFRYAYYEFIKEVSNQFKQKACNELDVVTSYISSSSGVGADDMGSKSGSAYSSKCKICGQYFGKMINAVIERTKTSAGSGFLTPWRKNLYPELAIKLSAMSDDKFMEMFPESAANNLLNQKDSLLECQKIFQNYLNELKNIPWDL